MSRVLVTGSDGFVGRHLLPRLNNEGFTLNVLNRSNGDLTTQNPWDEAPNSEIVVHLAAKSFVPTSWDFPEIYISENILSTVNALKYCRERKARLIFLSSYLYGNPDSLPISEDAKIKVNNPYGLSKMLCEKLCEYYFNQFHVKIVILRPFNIYGAYQPNAYLIPKIISQVKNSNSIKLNDLEPRRDFVYISDLISAIISSINSNLEFDIINIGSGESYSIYEIIAVVKELLDKEDMPVITNNHRRKNEIMETKADITKAKKLLNWSPSYNLKMAISDMLLKM